MNNTSPGGWQNMSPNPNPQWIVGLNGGQPQNNFGQNGGNMFGPPADPPFVGRYIDAIDEVMPKEIPMDGRAAIFPTKSLEEIYLRAWDRNGTIKTFRYILDPNQILNTPSMQEPDMGSKILERLEQLESKLNETQANKNANARNKSKGGDE